MLDKLLVDAAREAGAELREQFSVDALEMDDGWLLGIRAGPAGGTPIVERARIVVGADGMHSTVAQPAGASMYRVGPRWPATTPATGAASQPSDWRSTGVRGR